MSLAVANQYAKALLEVAGKPGSTLTGETALDQLEAFEAMLAGAPELRVALLSPAIPAAQKNKALARLAGMIGLHPVLANFLNVVANHRRIPLLASIRLAFRTQLDERLGIVRAKIAASRELSSTQKSAIESGLAATAGGSLRCTYSVDTALLGGLKVQIGSKVLDGSVRGQLDSMRRRLVAEA